LAWPWAHYICATPLMYMYMSLDDMFYEWLSFHLSIYVKYMQFHYIECIDIIVLSIFKKGCGTNLEMMYLNSSVYKCTDIAIYSTMYSYRSVGALVWKHVAYTQWYAVVQIGAQLSCTTSYQQQHDCVPFCTTMYHFVPYPPTLWLWYYALNIN
jgi:hypothetical protein